MSVPFFKTKKDAQDLWGKEEKLVKVYVPSSRGFIQARTSGNYWVPLSYARRLNLKRMK